MYLLLFPVVSLLKSPPPPVWVNERGVFRRIGWKIEWGRFLRSLFLRIFHRPTFVRSSTIMIDVSILSYPPHSSITSTAINRSHPLNHIRMFPLLPIWNILILGYLVKRRKKWMRDKTFSFVHVDLPGRRLLEQSESIIHITSLQHRYIHIFQTDGIGIIIYETSWVSKICRLSRI